MIGQVKKIAVIGSGTMGQGIAQVCATAGCRVLLYDLGENLVNNALAAIKKNLEALVMKNKISADKAAGALNRIMPVTDFRQLRADLVIEAVIENLEVKQEIFREIETLNDHDCIFTTNTSSISVTGIGSVLKHADRFAGLHFFNPAPQMKLVEIVRGRSTAEGVVETLKDFAAQLGKQPVLAQDSPGFIVNRVARHFYLESLKIAEDNTADFKTIDYLLKASGFRMGPFELMDLIGIDVNLAVTESVYKAFQQDPRFRPNRIQQQKVEAGHLGRKTGRGFYEY